MNLQVKVTDPAPCQKEFSVEVPAGEVDSEFEQVYKELKKVASVPGFRIGSAPRDLLEQYHGKKAREEVLQRLIDRSAGEALGAQRGLDLVTRPQITDVKFEPKQPLRYTMRVEISPEVPLGKYKGLALKQAKAQVSGEAVEDVLKRLQDQQAELKPMLEPRAAAVGDFLLVDLTEQAQGKQPVKRRDLVISLSLENDPEGLMKQLVGMQPGASRTLTLKDGTAVAVELKQIKVKDLPAIDDAFAKGLGQFDSLQALKDRIREDLQREAEAGRRRALEAQVVQQLLEGWSFEVPPSLVASQARRILKDRALELMGQGVASDEVQQRADMLAEQAKLDAFKHVKLYFILRRIAAEEKITAAQQEVDARIAALAQSLRATPEDVRKDLEQRDLLDELIWNVIRAKAIDAIVQQAEIKETS